VTWILIFGFANKEYTNSYLILAIKGYVLISKAGGYQVQNGIEKFLNSGRR
jgi:general stress protein CsbA